MEAEKYKYWVVGAAWCGTEHQDGRFIDQRFWMLGWEEGTQIKKASQIKIGDRIAIKRMKGRGQTGIRIMHIGIVKGVILDTNKVICTVEWCATNMNRNIENSKGCFRAIQGPYNMEKDGNWIREIFCL